MKALLQSLLMAAWCSSVWASAEEIPARIAQER